MSPENTERTLIPLNFPDDFAEVPSGTFFLGITLKLSGKLQGTNLLSNRLVSIHNFWNCKDTIYNSNLIDLAPS